MKSFAFVILMLVLNRVLLWLFPRSDTVLNYALLPVGLLGAILIVISEMKSCRVSPD